MAKAPRIPFTPGRDDVCPVPPETLVWVWIEGDEPTYNPRYLKPQPAGRYHWTKRSGIVAYAIAESSHD